MSNERIDLQWLLEEDGLMQDLNWSIARFEQVEKLVKKMTAELKRCYERLDAQKRQFSEIFELCSEYIDPRDVSEMTIQQGRILAEIWSMASYAKDEKELPDFTSSE